MTLGQRIQELRKQNNLSQEALGEKLGVSRQAISRWEMDGAVPEVDKLIAMGKLFGVSLNDLLQVESGPAGPEPKIVLALPRLWRGGVVVLALLTLLSLGGTAYLGWQLVGVERQLAAEQNALDSEMPMVADFDVDAQVWGDKTHIDYTFYLTVARQVEGMEVTLQMLDGDGQVHSLPLEVSEGTIYTGKTYLEFTTGRVLTISAVFRDSLGTAYTQPLQEITVSSSSTIRSTVLWDTLKQSLGESDTLVP